MISGMCGPRRFVHTRRFASGMKPMKPMLCAAFLVAVVLASAPAFGRAAASADAKADADAGQ